MQRQYCKTNRVCKGFSLVELVVVILIMGILAAVAAPKMFDKAEDARVNGTKRSLSVLRDAIELYKCKNGAYPANATEVMSGVGALLKGQFPANEILGGNDASKVTDTGDFTVPVTGFGWNYNPATGAIAINSAGHLTD
jgi:general secretion pathway protein G